MSSFFKGGLVMSKDIRAQITLLDEVVTQLKIIEQDLWLNNSLEATRHIGTLGHVMGLMCQIEKNLWDKYSMDEAASARFPDASWEAYDAFSQRRIWIERYLGKLQEEFQKEINQQTKEIIKKA